MVWLYLIAEAVAEELNLPRPFFGLEHPKDPETWASPAELGLEPPPEGFASCWALDAIKDLAEQHSLCYWHLDQRLQMRRSQGLAMGSESSSRNVALIQVGSLGPWS